MDGVRRSLGTAVAVGRLQGTRLNRGYPAQDPLLGALATHTFARLAAKDGLTTPLRRRLRLAAA